MQQLFRVARWKEALRTTPFPPFDNLPKMLAWHVRRANTDFIRLSTEVAAIQQLLSGPIIERRLKNSLESIQSLLSGGFDCKSLKETMARAMDPICDDTD